MRKLRSLGIATFAVTIFMLCFATGAFAGEVTSLTTDFTQNPFAPGDVSVSASMTQSAPESSITVVLFVIPEWDSTCSAAGYPGGPIDEFYAYVAATQFSSQPSADFGVNTIDLPEDVGFCIGAAASSDGTNWIVKGKHMQFGKPQIEIGDENNGPNSVGVDYDVNPAGLTTTHWLNYFKKVNTDQCNTPDADDLLTAQDTAHATIYDDLNNPHTISASIAGLDVETQYCVSFHATNLTGDYDSAYGTYETKGLAPVIANAALTSSATNIHYALDVTPGTNYNDVELDVQYFEQTGGSCTNEPDPIPTWYHSFPTDTAKGFDPVHAEGDIDGLTPGKTYCIRPIALNLWGGSAPTAFQAVTTTAPLPATISTPQVTLPATEDDFPVLSTTLGDGGAQAGINTISNYDVLVHHVTPDRCNSTDYYGGTTILDQSSWFTDEQDLEFDLHGLVVGESYCIAVFVQSAWGSDYNAETYKSFTYGNAPTVTGVSNTVSTNSMTFNATVNPGSVTTDYGVKYKVKPAATACSAVTSGWTTKEQTLASGIDTDQAVSVVVNGLTPATSYCAYFYADNEWGAFASAKIQVTTAGDTTAPSVPTGVAKATGSMNTLKWDAASDDIGVTAYLVYKNGVLDKTVATAVAGVTLAQCETASFTVASRDAAGNVSAQSAAVVLSDEGCPPPSDGDGNKGAPNALPTLGKFPVKVPHKKLSKTFFPVSCPTGCTLELKLSGFGKKAKPTTISVAASESQVKLKVKLVLPGYTPAQLLSAWKKKVGKKTGQAKDNVCLILAVTAENSAGKSATKKIRLTID